MHSFVVARGVGGRRNGGKGENEGRRLFMRQLPSSSSLVYQWSSFTTLVIGNFLKSIAGIMNDGH